MHSVASGIEGIITPVILPFTFRRRRTITSHRDLQRQRTRETYGTSAGLTHTTSASTSQGMRATKSTSDYAEDLPARDFLRKQRPPTYRRSHNAPRGNIPPPSPGSCVRLFQSHLSTSTHVPSRWKHYNPLTENGWAMGGVEFFRCLITKTRSYRNR